MGCSVGTGAGAVCAVARIGAGGRARPTPYASEQSVTGEKRLIVTGRHAVPHRPGKLLMTLSLPAALFAPGDRTDGAAVARRTRALWDAMDAALVPLIGAMGFAILFMRCVQLAQRRHPWLDAVPGRHASALGADALCAALATRGGADAADCSIDIIGAFHDALGQLVGAALAATLLRAGAPRALAGAGAPPASGRAGQLAQLRDANEHLVVASVRAQIRSDEVARAKDALSHLAYHDLLTDLPNRALLTARLSQAIGQARRDGARLAMLFLDLDGFKVINDSLGHAVGDAVLCLVAERLQLAVRATDTASRQGGDEFLVLLAGVADERAVAELCDKLCQAIGQPYELAGQRVCLGVTIGVAMFPGDGDDAAALIASADTAMYHGKRAGGGSYRFYGPAMNARAVERQRLEADLQRALDEGQFALHYQPRVELASGVVTGAEALLRWRHPTLGWVAPARFIPVAEQCGLIVQIGQWVLAEACRQAACWRAGGLAFGVVSINVSALELLRPEFVDGVRAALAASGLAPSCLELELTEGVFMRDAPAGAAVLQQLKALGLSVALDDFGTGYSSLSHLTQFPIDVLKIDQSFVGALGASGGESAIVGAVIAMGASLGQRVVAEGIETHAQLAFLRARGCAEGQGFLFSPALTPAQLGDLLARGGPLGRD